jgi:hypothetical protein
VHGVFKITGAPRNRGVHGVDAGGGGSIRVYRFKRRSSRGFYMKFGFVNRSRLAAEFGEATLKLNQPAAIQYITNGILQRA